MKIKRGLGHKQTRWLPLVSFDKFSKENSLTLSAMSVLCLLAKMPSCTVHVSALECGQSIDMQLQWPREQGSCQGCSGLKKQTKNKKHLTLGLQRGEFFFSSTRLKNRREPEPPSKQWWLVRGWISTLGSTLPWTNCSLRILKHCCSPNYTLPLQWSGSEPIGSWPGLNWPRRSAH